jgi:hypothetical protein
MRLEDVDFYFAWPDAVSVQAKIEWTVPSTHDVLFSGLIAEDATAYFYAIVSLDKKIWFTHYIGKVYVQNSSKRHRAADHIARLKELQLNYPGRTFHLTLGTPRFDDGLENPDELIIDQIEGLLIYSNWSEKMINKRRIDTFHCSRQISLENTGFISHLCKRSAYGIFWNND